MTGFSKRELAAKALAHHSFERGNGYINHGRPPLANPGTASPDNCNPPANTPEGSFHRLRSPQGSEVVLRWVGSQATWGVTGGARLKAHRLGYTARYLSKAGWVYVAPTERRDH